MSGALGHESDFFFTEDQETEELPDNLKDDSYISELAQQMKNLDIAQFHQSQLEVHGIAEPLDESPEMIERLLAELDLWIDRLKASRSGRVYRIAEKQSLKFVTDRKFRLMFLRAECLDPKKAAKRMLFHMEKKLELWGEEKLCKEITREDLDSDDLESLENGHFTMLPLRDLTGRLVIFTNVCEMKFKEIKNHVSSATGSQATVLVKIISKTRRSHNPSCFPTTRHGQLGT